MTALLVSLTLVLEIRAAGECPGRAAIQRRLTPLLAPGAAALITDVATVEHGADGTLLLSLEDAGGRPIGSRRFPRSEACNDQADTVAVTLAIWEAQLHPEISLRLDRLGPPPAPIAEARLPAPRAELSLGLSFAGDWLIGAWAPAGRLELGFRHRGGRWRGRLGGLGIGRHTRLVGPGEARWWRVSLSVGVEYDVFSRVRWGLTLGVGALGGMATISGAGYTIDRTSRSVDVGGEARARIEWRPGVVRPWIGAGLVGWARPQRLELVGSSESSLLPRVEPAVAVGVDFVW